MTETKWPIIPEIFAVWLYTFFYTCSRGGNFDLVLIDQDPVPLKLGINSQKIDKLQNFSWVEKITLKHMFFLPCRVLSSLVSISVVLLQHFFFPLCVSTYISCLLSQLCLSVDPLVNEFKSC